MSGIILRKQPYRMPILAAQEIRHYLETARCQYISALGGVRNKFDELASRVSAIKAD